MDLTEQNIARLILKHFKEDLSCTEKQELEQWLNASPANRSFFEELNEGDDIVHLVRQLQLDQQADIRNLLKAEINRRIQQGESAPAGAAIRPLRIAGFWYAAAAIVMVLTAGWFWNQANKPASGIGEAPVATETNLDVAPGSDRAILTLSNGQQVELNEDGTQVITDGDLAIASVNGELLYKAADRAVINTMTTPRGGQYRVTLADGTKVWLNAASSITYPTRFDGATREVRITGEVYFAVEKDKNKPFIVKTPEGSVEVLGTEFNINAYRDEIHEATTLVEGSVRLNYLNLKKELKPGQQSRVTAQPEKIEISDVNVDNVTAWKNNLFIFNNADIPAIMRQLSRWYDLDIQYKGTVPRKPYNGKMPRDMKLADVLSALKLAGVRLEIYDKTLVISGVN